MAILPILGSVLGAVAKVVGDYVASPIKNQFSYLCCFNSNIEKLGDEVHRLEPRRASLQQQLDAAKRNVEVVLPDVEDWLERAREIKSANDRIRGKREEIQEHCFHGWCVDLRLRYSLSREAKKKAKASVELRDKDQFTRISITACPADLEPIPAKSEIEFDSRKAVEEQIMDALKDNNVYMIGICGMGGIGKTTIVTKIEKRVIEEQLFGEVVMATVSQQQDLLKIQEEIAERLGVKLVEKIASDLRARRLHARLKDAKSVLIILDDVWGRLNLKELGIPSPSSSVEELGIPSPSSNVKCKVILTSRIRHVCIEMNAAKILSLEVLSEQEAWILFREKAGRTFDPPDLHCIAEEVARECKGLPLALVTVGSALRGRIKPAWEDALQQLRQPPPATNIPEYLKDVYRPLELSYNQLGSPEDRYLLLLCCLFPEDSSIDIEDLVHYRLGLRSLDLRIFSGVENLTQARNRVHGIVETLKDRSLLMNEKTGNINSVKMHDVIRDMVISIASTAEHIFWICHDTHLKDWPERDSYDCYTFISLILGEDIVLPERVNCQRLQALHMKLAGKVSDNFFEGMTGLRVLDFQEASFLPSSLPLLTNLRTLHLHSCRSIFISMIGELLNLEILSLRNSEITVFPKEIGRLKKLKSLDLSRSSHLERIEPGAVSGLVRLEELFMKGCISFEWGADIDGNPFENKANASLGEVASLRNLTTLMIHISNANLPYLDTPQWEQLRRYRLIIGSSGSRLKSDNYNTVVNLAHLSTPLSNWIHDLLRNAEVLELRGKGSDDGVMRLAREGFQNVKRLLLYRCNNVEYLAKTRYSSDDLVFPIAETISLSRCEDLKEICQGLPPAGSFGALEQLELKMLSKLMHLWNQKLHLANLRSIRISDCSSLLFVFPLSTLENLLELQILNCPVLEEVFKDEGGQSGSTVSQIILPKLNFLHLESLPSLSSFCKAFDGFEFPLLHNLIIKGLPNLRNFFPIESGVIEEGEHRFGRSFLFNQKVISASLINLELYNVDAARGIFSNEIPVGTFSRLLTLKVGSCQNVKTIFSPPTHKNFTSLYDLTIEHCSKLEEVIVKEDEESQQMVKEILFPSLENLTLSNLPNIRLFCHMKNAVEVPSLSRVIVRDCPKMENFCLGAFSTREQLKVYGNIGPELATHFFSDVKDLLLM